ncbi:MAG: hypothetical protein CMJ76_16765 [Planctomycetaceae bacterium]|nr:hypothetical protein [Planctomycetaceae bacterium]
MVLRPAGRVGIPAKSPPLSIDWIFLIPSRDAGVCDQPETFSQWNAWTVDVFKSMFFTEDGSIGMIVLATKKNVSQ